MRRAPLLVPSPQGWAGRDAVRSMRVRASADGELLLDLPGGRTKLLARQGAVTRIVLSTEPPASMVPPYAAGNVPACDYGLAVFLSGATPVVAIWVAEWLPTTVRNIDPRDVRDASGLNAVADALGRPVEHGDAPLAAAAAGVVVSPRPRVPVGARVALAAAYAALLVWFVGTVAAPFGGDVRPNLVGYAGALGAVVVTAVPLVLARRAGRPLPAPPGHVVTPAPRIPAARAFRERSRVYVSAEWLVFTDPVGREAWVPGPALGGVVTASFTTDAVVFEDVSGVAVAALPRDAWLGDTAADRALRAALADVGVRVGDEPSSRAPGEWITSPVVVAAMDDRVFSGVREARGVPSRGAVLGAVAGTVVAFGAAYAEDTVTLAVGALAAIVATGVGVAGYRAEQRAKEKT